MKKKLLVIALSLAILSCNTMPTNSPSSVKATSSPSPVLPKKLVDVPSLIGKTPEEVISIIGITPEKTFPWADTNSMGDLRHTYEFKDIKESVSVDFRNGKFERFHLTFLRFSFKTPEELADLFGVDLRGKTPTRTIFNEKETVQVVYEGFKLNGVKVKEITCYKVFDKMYDTFVLSMVEGS